MREQLLEARGPRAKLAAMERALAKAWRPVEHHAAVSFALDEFRRQPDRFSMAAVAGAIGLSPKRFIERFQNHVKILQSSAVDS